MKLDNIYQLRKDFTVIGLTGRTGSGCTELAELMSKGFDEDNELYPNPEDYFKGPIIHNSYRKYRIIYNFAKENFKSYYVIKYKDVILLHILNKSFDEFIEFLKSTFLKKEFEKSKLSSELDFDKEIEEFNKFKKDFDDYKEEISNLFTFNLSDDATKRKELYNIYESKRFYNFIESFNNAFSIVSVVKRNKTLQVISNNIRKTGNPYEMSDVLSDTSHLFDICKTIKLLIKGNRDANSNKARIVVDSFRNPLELMYFRQRFSAFYIVAVSKDDSDREIALKDRLKEGYDQNIKNLLKEEYKGGKRHEFYKQNVGLCIQYADIHITTRSRAETENLNKEVGDNTSPFFTTGMQLLKYVSLIDQPGIITPSPEERCMQIAYTAKYNSGCISRQVGAAITDQFYSLKAIGWNNTPEGQVPCNLRNINDLFENGIDKNSFTPFEKEDPKFSKVLKDTFQLKLEKNNCDLGGRNVCFCFKSVYNSYEEGKNQVHTRSLHAEESAFLQIAKYGGQGILNGKLFTTASPCELCSKKAFQLGIKIIYYIDPYPGIALNQILNAGSDEKNPKMRLFNGAIGNAYHWLYEPFIAYKDELNLILDIEIKDLVTDLKDELSDKEAKIRELESEIKKLNNLNI